MSAETTALAKHPCPACGAQAQWNPTRQRLVCPFCGTEAPAQVDERTGQVQELDLANALREVPDEQRGWQANKHAVQCRNCKAVSVFDAGRVGQNCDFCGGAALVDYREIKAPLRPQSLLPFRVSESQVRERVRAWFGGHWLAPSALQQRALMDTLRGIYVPYWTFDAQVHCPWQAEAGYFEYETESYVDSNGHQQTRQVQNTRWEPVSGVVDHFFDDQPVPGSRGIDAALLRQLEPFPTHELVPYDTSFLSGFVVEHYQVVLLEAAQRGRDAMIAQLRTMCAQRIPGQTQRNLQIQPTFSGQTFKHVLLPVWLLHYDYGKKRYQVVVNGYTGAIAGRTPKSAWKVAALVLAILVVLVIIGGLLTR